MKVHMSKKVFLIASIAILGSTIAENAPDVEVGGEFFVDNKERAQQFVDAGYATLKPEPTLEEQRDAQVLKLRARIISDTARIEALLAGPLEPVRKPARAPVENLTASVGDVIEVRLGRAGSEATEAKPPVYAEDGVTVLTPGRAAKAATEGTLRFVQATVIGVKDAGTDDVRYKVEHGDGFDKETAVIQGSQILSIVSGSTEETAA